MSFLLRVHTLCLDEAEFSLSPHSKRRACAHLSPLFPTSSGVRRQSVPNNSSPLVHYTGYGYLLKAQLRKQQKRGHMARCVKRRHGRPESTSGGARLWMCPLWGRNVLQTSAGHRLDFVSSARQQQHSPLVRLRIGPSSSWLEPVALSWELERCPRPDPRRAQFFFFLNVLPESNWKTSCATVKNRHPTSTPWTGGKKEGGWNGGWKGLFILEGARIHVLQQVGRTLNSSGVRSGARHRRQTRFTKKKDPCRRTSSPHKPNTLDPIPDGVGLHLGPSTKGAKGAECLPRGGAEPRFPWTLPFGRPCQGGGTPAV